MPTLIISNKGQITLPARVRHQLGLESHGKIDLEVQGEAIILRPARSIRSVRGVFRPLEDAGAGRDWEAVRAETERQIAEETAGEDR